MDRFKKRANRGPAKEGLRLLDILRASTEDVKHGRLVSEEEVFSVLTVKAIEASREGKCASFTSSAELFENLGISILEKD